MQRSPLLASVSLVCLLASGCITINTFGSAHPAGFNVVLCDGSVRLISYTIDEFNYMRLGNRGDGQTLDWNF